MGKYYKKAVKKKRGNSEDPQDFVNIGRALGISVSTVKIAYISGLKKIRSYLLEHKDLRHSLQDNLTYLDNLKCGVGMRDLPSKKEDDSQ